jgi:antitoxin (DNA-binding transcriptional repressor) of toxin-antitoxin stability system
VIESSILVSNSELFTVRDAMRGLNRIVDRIERGEIEKAVLMRNGRMVAVVAPLATSEGEPRG